MNDFVITQTPQFLRGFCFDLYPNTKTIKVKWQAIMLAIKNYFMDYFEYLKPSLQKRQKRRDKRLDEELIECYRIGERTKGKKGYKNKQKRNQYEHARQKESIKFMHGGGTKTFNDNLEPLMRYLRSNTGRPWNRVYSELCTKLDKTTVSGLHVFNHVFDFVSEHVWIENKKVYKLKNGHKEELTSWGSRKQFYVHPKTGLLLMAKEYTRWKYSRDGKA